MPEQHDSDTHPAEPDASGAAGTQTWGSDITAADKARLLGEIDLDAQTWQRTDPPGERVDDAMEIAVVDHTDGQRYWLMRSSAHPRVVLLFDRPEWAAWVAGVKAGEFDV